MPQAINLVLKNAANVDKTFTLMSPAAGDGSYANWRLKEGATSLAFPRVAVATRVGASARKANIKLQIPATYLDARTGLPVVASTFDFNADITVPDGFPESSKDDAVAFVTNLIANAVIKAIVRDAVPAT